VNGRAITLPICDGPSDFPRDSHMRYARQKGITSSGAAIWNTLSRRVHDREARANVLFAESLRPLGAEGLVANRFTANAPLETGLDQFTRENLLVTRKAWGARFPHFPMPVVVGLPRGVGRALAEHPSGLRTASGDRAGDIGQPKPHQVAKREGRD